MGGGEFVLDIYIYIYMNDDIQYIVIYYNT